jgi:hypothetical protein
MMEKIWDAYLGNIEHVEIQHPDCNILGKKTGFTELVSRIAPTNKGEQLQGQSDRSLSVGSPQLGKTAQQKTV